MANTYSWDFSALDIELGPDAENHTDIVYTIHWRYIADDGEGHTASSIDTSSVTWEENDPWIPYEDIIKSDVEGWVVDQIGVSELAEMKLRLDANIEEQVSPTRQTNREMPWNNGA